MLYEELGIKYKYYDPNPSDNNREHSDCAVRAYTKMLNKSWEEVYDELADEGKKSGYIQCSQGTVFNMAKNNNLDYLHDFRDDDFIMTIAEFLSKIKNKGISCMVGSANHVVYFEDNTIYDRNCSESEKGDIDRKSQMLVDSFIIEDIDYYIATDKDSEKIIDIIEGKITKPIQFKE